MKSADDYCSVFEKTHQIDNLYFVVSSHARGKTFHIFILPQGEAVNPNGSRNPPLNPNAVEVYGIVSGQPGWTESYGWLHRGPWESDVQKIYNTLKAAQQKRVRAKEDESVLKAAQENTRIQKLLATYR